ncbi:MAG: molybdenum cofactor carrier [Kiritimatiellae bacterium]|nr:molybdenum cofactor carrier [Kiritimatiellia bacterium]
MAEDGTIPEQYRERMQGHPSMGGGAQDYRERTKANVRDSHATLILVDSLPLSGGTKLTENTAVAMMRSHKVVAMTVANAKDDALKWLRQFLGMSSALVLNIAGPRESNAPGIQASAKAFLEELLWEA